jgi:hypothetical protein
LKFEVTRLIQSAVLYRVRHTAKNSIIFPPTLPEGYYNEGNYSTQCEPISASEGFKYCEDEDFWDIYDDEGKLTERLLITSCDAGRRQWNTVMGPLLNPDPRGTLWVYSFQESDTIVGTAKNIVTTGSTKPKAKQIELAGYPEGHDFHPLGMAIYPSYGGAVSYLFVINHARQRTFIEQFELSPSKPTVAKHLRTLDSPHFIAPNSLALTSPYSFYVSNDHRLTRRLPAPFGGILATLESTFAVPLSWVAHVTLDPEISSADPVREHKYVATGIPFANGISIAPQDGEDIAAGELFAVAATSASTVRFFRRDPSTNDLTPEEDVLLPFLPDNIHFLHDEQNKGDLTLLVTGHVSFPGLLSLVAGKAPYAPGWSVAIKRRSATAAAVGTDNRAPISAYSRIPAPGPTNYSIETVVQTDGRLVSSMCTALRDSRTGLLFLTGLYEEKGAFVCKPE